MTKMWGEKLPMFLCFFRFICLSFYLFITNRLFIKMTKYIPEDTSVTFSEVPNEISLCINISNCLCHCEGCHSAYLRSNIGEELTTEKLDELILANDGITCVCFMGEGNDPEALQALILHVKENHKNLKIALYSGREDVPEDFYWNNLDYLKIGPYKPEFGPLNKTTTNQVLYRKLPEYFMSSMVNGVWRTFWENETYLFWTPEDYKKYKEEKLEETKKKIREEIMNKPFE